MIVIEKVNGTSLALVALLEAHLADMRAISPPESVHALDVAALENSDIRFWLARVGAERQAVGCIALKALSPHHGEIKSMRVVSTARHQGVASALLKAVIEAAKARQYRRLSLETGTQAFFLPAHRLYEKFGFCDCPPFADYVLDENSRFMTLNL